MKYFKSISVVALLMTMVFLGIGTAQAQSHSLYCPTITPIGEGIYDIHIGLDVYMSEWDARAILDGGGYFEAKMYGDDSFTTFDNFLFYMDLKPGWPAAGPSGLSVEFGKVVGGSSLNENNAWWDNDDELYVKISLYDPRPAEFTHYFYCHYTGDY